MVFWRIKYNGDSFGYQVMDDDLSNARLIDDTCQPLEGGFDYEFVEVTDAPACWVQ